MPQQLSASPKPDTNSTLIIQVIAEAVVAVADAVDSAVTVAVAAAVVVGSVATVADGVVVVVALAVTAVDGAVLVVSPLLQTFDTEDVGLLGGEQAGSAGPVSSSTTRDGDDVAASHDLRGGEKWRAPWHAGGGRRRKAESRRRGGEGARLCPASGPP